jgi:O-antigen/teichoic acid export membrane protein
MPGLVRRSLNTGARSLTLLAKFLLLFAVAARLTPEDVGAYGLLVAYVAYALLLTGLDFHAFTTRELLRDRSQGRGWIVKSQLSLAVVTHLCFAPLFLAVFALGALPWLMALWFFPLLVLEHIAQEINRILIAVSDQVAATLILFLRMGAWGLVVIVLMQTVPDTRSLTFVLASWVVGVSVAVAVGAWRIRSLSFTGWSVPLDWPWIRTGIGIALPMLVGTLTVRALFTADRFWLEATLGRDALAAYVLYAGIAVALTTVLEAGVFSYSYPSLIAQFSQGKVNDFRALVQKTARETVWISVGYSVVTVILIGPIVARFESAVYERMFDLYPWSLLSMLLYSLSLVPHYGLYAMGKDRQIIASQIVALSVFVAATGVLVRAGTQYAVPQGLCCAFAMLLAWKMIAYSRNAKA